MSARYVNGTVTVVSGGIGTAPADVNPLKIVRNPLAVIGDARVPGRNLQLVLTSEAGNRYMIEVSTNLVDWLELTRGLNRTGTQYITDPAAANFKQRFYRVRLIAP